jgi:bacterioferritin-associated ferredoxin
MNKAFIREPDPSVDYCPRCGSKGERVEARTLAAYLSDAQRGQLAEPADFCPSPQCPVAYFDAFERIVLAVDLRRPAYPKDPAAPICACFGVTRAEIEQDVREGVVTRTRAMLARAKSSAARCSETAANGRCCVAHIQKYYMQRRNELKGK